MGNLINDASFTFVMVFSIFSLCLPMMMRREKYKFSYYLTVYSEGIKSSIYLKHYERIMETKIQLEQGRIDIINIGSNSSVIHQVQECFLGRRIWGNHSTPPLNHDITYGGPQIPKKNFLRTKAQNHLPRQSRQHIRIKKPPPLQKI